MCAGGGQRREPAFLTPAMLAMSRERVKTPPHDGVVWTLTEVAAGLGRFRVAEQSGWEDPRAIGWTIQRPRPWYPQAATPEEQAAFNSSPGGGGSPARPSRSSPSTRTASG
jgi:hypothetical protein